MNEPRNVRRLLPVWASRIVGLLLLAMSFTTHAIEARVRAGFEAGDTTWVGQQVGFYVDVMTNGVRFSGQRIRLPEVPGALILEDAVSTVMLTEQIDGESWQIIRYSYPMFVQREGRVDIKPIVAEFNVYETYTGDPVAFDKASTAMSLQVERPPGVTDARMLVTTSDFSVSITITPEPDSLIVGDALTQTVTRHASDVSGMAFAPIPVADVSGIATYPKAPDVDDRHNRGLLTGTRVDSVTYVLEQPGEFEIPEVRLIWWNPKSAQLNTETIPALSLMVEENPVLQSEQDATVAPPSDARKYSKQLIALALAAIAVLVLGAMFGSKYRRWLARRRAEKQHSEPVRFKNLLRACSSNDPSRVYNDYYRWLTVTGEQQKAICDDKNLADELICLQHALVHQESNWRGRSFAAAMRKARQMKSIERSKSTIDVLSPTLNPVRSARAEHWVLIVCVSIFMTGAAVAESVSEEESSRFSYGDKGLQYESADGNNFLWFGVRLQTRYSNSAIDHDDEPGRPTENGTETKLNRGRLKLGGHLISPRLAVYSEYDFSKSQLLDLRVTYEFADWLSIRVGQWKSTYNRERSDSSGAQQFADRSIATPWFTVDRQKGIVASGRVGAGKALDSSYWFGRLSGAGRGGDLDDADGLWLGRYQWNFSKRVLGFSQSDIGRRDKPAGSIAIAVVSGKSMFTQFSGAGGGQLPGFENGEPDRYRIRQALFETAWQYRGFSWQQELHWKKITDSVTNVEQKIVGGYAQAGMFFSEIWGVVPEPLEFALRFAVVDPDGGDNEGIERESILAANWFFKGHRNKLTADISRIRRREVADNETETRVRLQWDVSF